MPRPMSERSDIERAIARAFRPDSRVTRRSFLRQTGRGAVVAGSALTIPRSSPRAASTRRDRRPGRAPRASDAAGALEWANWPLYIDIDDDGNYPSLVAFTEETGIEVNYTEAIQDNADFMGVILPDLQAGNPTGWDIITPGGWVVERLARLEVLEELDHSQLPNWTANAADYAKGLWFDPDNRYSLWWQGGITGIAYDPELTGREITTFDDLLDPAFEGVAGAFSDMRDMFGLTLLSLGVEPANATVDDVTRARDKLLEANGRNQFRGYYGNEYYDALAAGDLAISVAWSGDITQMQLNDNDKVQFVIPQDGAMRWNDNFAIPKGAVAHQGRPQADGLLLRRPRRDADFGVHRLLHRGERRPGADRRRRRGVSRRWRHRECRLLRRRGADGRAHRGPAREHVHRQGADRGGGGRVERPLARGEQLSAGRARPPWAAAA